jgi:hypothetical protein
MEQNLESCQKIYNIHYIFFRNMMKKTKKQIENCLYSELSSIISEFKKGTLL